MMMMMMMMMMMGTKQICTNKRKGQGNPFHQFREDVFNLCLVHLVERLVVVPPSSAWPARTTPSPCLHTLKGFVGKALSEDKTYKLWLGAGHYPLEEDANGRPAMEFCLGWMLERIK